MKILVTNNGKIMKCLPEHYKFISTAWKSTDATGKALKNLKTKMVMEEEKIKSEEPQVIVEAEKNKIKCSYCNVGHTKERLANNKQILKYAGYDITK